MRRVAVCLAVVLAAGAAAKAQTLPPDAAAAYAVGEASAHLRQAAPCFPNTDLGRQINAMMRSLEYYLYKYKSYQICGYL